MPFDDPAFVEVHAAVQRDLYIYHRVMAKRQQEQRQQAGHATPNLSTSATRVKTVHEAKARSEVATA